MGAPAGSHMLAVIEGQEMLLTPREERSWNTPDGRIVLQDPDGCWWLCTITPRDDGQKDVEFQELEIRLPGAPA